MRLGGQGLQVLRIREAVERMGGTHYGLDHFGWWPTFPAAKSLLVASLVISRHSDIFSAGLLVTPQIPSPLLSAEDGEALSKRSLDDMQRLHVASRIFAFVTNRQAAADAIPTHRLICRGRDGGTGDFHIALRLFMKARDHCHLQGRAPSLADELHTSIEGPRLKLIVWRPCNLRQVGATKPFRTWSLGMHHVQGSLDLHLHCTLSLSEGCKFARHTRIDLSSHFFGDLEVSSLHQFLK